MCPALVARLVGVSPLVARKALSRTCLQKKLRQPDSANVRDMPCAWSLPAFTSQF
jgi:hypothetical protein